MVRVVSGGPPRGGVARRKQIETEHRACPTNAPAFGPGKALLGPNSTPGIQMVRSRVTCS